MIASQESHISHQRNRRRMVIRGMGLVVSLGLFIGCSQNTDAQNEVPIRSSSTTEPKVPKTSVADRSEKVWQNGLLELREMVATSKPVTLLVARDTCVAWPAAIKGAYTVVHNPSMYNYNEGQERVTFMPFVISTIERTPTVMNGPYSYLSPDGSEEGNMSSAIFENSKIQTFNQEVHSYSIVQGTEPGPFPAAWLEAEDGTRISETKVVAAEDVAAVFGGVCDIEVPHKVTQTASLN